MLSTAILEPAVTSTFLSLATNCQIISHNVLVLPVPGGPCIENILSAFKAFITAVFYSSFNKGSFH